MYFIYERRDKLHCDGIMDILILLIYIYSHLMDFSVWNFLAGLAIVLFGMELLEDTIHDLSGASLKKWLKKLTSTPLQAICSAFGVTALLQSSSVTSLMILAFA